jgi:glycosyltransferase involved in cell wall biosynthesis
LNYQCSWQNTPKSEMMTTTLELSVVIPAYNEIKTIEEILVRVQAVPIQKQIIVVDDGSTDGTREFLQALAAEIQASPRSKFGRIPRIDNIRVVFQPRNAGKGAALRRGFKEAEGDIVVIQDADLELNPDEYSKMIVPIRSNSADVVYGSRFRGKSAGNQPFVYFVANKILTVTSNLLTGLHLTDVWTGYKMFRREVLNRFELQEDRFGFEPEMTAKLARAGCRVQEVGVAYECRSREEGKKIGWKDCVRGMWCTGKYSLLPESRGARILGKRIEKVSPFPKSQYILESTVDRSTNDTAHGHDSTNETQGAKLHKQ